MAELEIAPEKVCWIIIKAREFDAKVEVDDPDPGSDAIDDKGVGVLEDYLDDSTAAELKTFIDELNEDEQIQLVALVWLGRGDYAVDEWGDAVKEARDQHNKRTSEYLMGMPTLGDYLEEGLAQHDLSCGDFEMGHL